MHGPRHWTAALIVLAAAAIVLVALFLILPTMRQLLEAHKEVAALQVRLEQQQVLFPFHAEVASRFRRETSSMEALPAKGALPRTAIPGLQQQMAQLAGKHGLELGYAVPEVESISEGYGTLSVSTVVRGQLDGFQGFLEEVLRWPFLRHLERIRIERTAATREFRLKLWLAIE